MNEFAERHFEALDRLLMHRGRPRPDIWIIHGPTDPHLDSYADVAIAWVESDRCVLTAAFQDTTLNHSLMFSVKTYNKFMLEEPDERTD